MPAEVIEMKSVARSNIERASDASCYVGFCKALAVVKLMLPCNAKEVRASLEQWLAEDRLTRGEFAALAQFYGWEVPA